MDPDDELDDDRSSGPLLPPDDRLWRHPSELAVLHPTTTRAAEHRIWAVAVFAGLVGAIAATGMTFATGSLRTHKVAVPVLAVEQQMMTPVMTLASAAGAGMAASVAEVRPSCVSLLARDAHGTRESAGVVFRSDGMILAAAHMVTGARSLEATVEGSRKVAAHVVAADTATDLAVVKLDGTGYTPAPLGTALAVRVGDPVVAVSPSYASVAQGLVAGVGKTATSSGNDLDGLLQITTDRPPETIGSPVLDRQGAVIGVASAIGKGSVEFATPMDWARQVADQLLNRGKVVPVWLGVLGHDLSPAAAAALGVSGGAVIDKIYASSPASTSGLKVGDQVLGIDGRAVPSMANLITAVRARAEGSTVELEVRRGTTTWSMPALLTPRPAEVN